MADRRGTSMWNATARALRAAPLVAVLAGAALVAPRTGQAAGSSIVMVPHRAIYEMTLASARGGSSVTQVSGRMVYELVGSACEGYTQNMRFVTQMQNQNGAITLTDLRSSSWEEGTGKRFRFNSSQFRDEKATEVTAGDAARAPATNDVKVELTKPAKRDIQLSARTYFPVQHSIALIEAARAGKASFRADLYDGSEKGEKVYDTVSAIGRKTLSTAPERLTKTKTAAERLVGVPAWPVSIAYYEPRSDNRDAVPVYELSFLFLENGVSQNMLIDYGDFAIQGDLKEITFMEPGKCEAAKR
ncbi:MAG: cell envelope integrity EipB family protein [Hyphomicrobiaceae bacterium]|nr:cell envelope integrity EipB family protein [Hyphomicrobiaceae bacterium]